MRSCGDSQGYLLDTNILTELTRQRPDKNVIAWLEKQNPETLFISTITTAELLGGAALMPKGKKRLNLEAVYAAIIAQFMGRIYDFDLEASRIYAFLAETAKLQGKGFPLPDGFIPAIAASKNLIVATRDIAPFKAGNVNAINPFES